MIWAKCGRETPVNHLKWAEGPGGKRHEVWNCPAEALASQPRPKLEKVRVALEAAVDRMQEEGCDCNEPHDPPCALCLCKLGLDELDAAERGE